MIMQQQRALRRMIGGPTRARNAPTGTSVHRVHRAAGFACVLLLGASALAGCAQKAAAAASLELGTAYVAVPNTSNVTSAYLVIRNNGPADRLLSARTSDGGRVTFREPSRAGDRVMVSVPDIAIPADTLLRLSPDGSHLLITGAGPMKGGTQITLTLTFAKGGTMSVVAAVTNPESGGSSYFLN
jgi:periplasmic copper chaperone A